MNNPYTQMKRSELRAACKEAGIQYSKLTVGGMRDTLTQRMYDDAAIEDAIQDDGMAGYTIPADTSFRAAFEAHKAAGKSKCGALRATAHGYKGTRKNFISDAMECDIKSATASANWAAMVRGEW